MATPSASWPALTNKSVLELLATCDDKPPEAAKRVMSILAEHNVRGNEHSIKMKIVTAVKTYKKLRRRTRDISKLQAFMNSIFTIRPQPPEPTSSDPIESTPMAHAISPPDAEQPIVSETLTPLTSDPVQSDMSAIMSPVPVSATSSSSLSVKLRLDCDRCESLRKEKSDAYESLHKKYLSVWRSRRAISKNLVAKRVNQTIKRKTSSLQLQSQKVQQLQAENVDLKKTVNRLKLADDLGGYFKTLRREQRLRKSSESALSRCEAKVKMLERMLKDEKERVRSLEDQLTSTATDDLATKDTVYNNNVRLCVFKSLLCNVPVMRTGELLQFVSSELNETQLIAIPSQTTVSRMVHELGVLSDIQAGQALFDSTNTTLAWDATSIDGTHVNEVHIHTHSQMLYLQVGHLPGGRTEDYLQHITDTLGGIAKTFADFSGNTTEDVLFSFYNGITCCLSDRAAVNNCVSSELSLLMSKELIYLNCNVHPLDGLASCTRKALLSRDKALNINSTVYGKDCRAANFIYAVSKLRHNPSSGDPQGLKIFLTRSNIHTGIIPRYVGNRLHILFHSAGIIFHLRTSLTTFLQKYCSAAQRKAAQLGDLSNEDLLAQLKVLGLFGKLLTGQWMKKFYQNEDQKQHLEMIPYMTRMFSRPFILHI